MLARLAYLYYLGWDLGETPSDGYVFAARKLAEGELTYRINKAPVFTGFYTAFLYFFGENFLLLRLLQVVMAATCVVPIVLIGKQLFSERVGLIAAAIYSIYPQLLHYPTELMAEVFYTFMLLWFMYFFFRALEEPTWRRSLVAGLWLGMAIFSRGEMYVFVPAVVLVYLAYFWHRKREGLTFLAPVYAMCLAVYVVWKLFVYLQFGQFSAVPERTGLNLWRAVPDYEEVYQGEDIERDTVLHALDERTRDQRYLNVWLETVLDDPMKLLQPMGEKFVVFWRFYPRTVNLMGEEAPGRRVLLYQMVGLLTFLPLLLLALAALYLGRAHWRPLLVFVLLFAVFTVVHMFFSAHGRYRAPIMPYLMLMAAFTLDWLWVQGGVWRRRRVPAGRAA